MGKAQENRICHLAQGAQSALSLLYALMMGGILAVCLFFSHISFARSELCRHYLPPLFLAALGGAFLFLLFLCCERLKLWEQAERPFLLAASLLLFLLQAYAVYNYYFYTDWDVPHLIRLSDAVAHGGDTREEAWYFSYYPNNLFLVYIFSRIRLLAHSVGLHAHEYFAILCMQCLLNTLTGLLLAQTLKKLFPGGKMWLLGYALYLLLVGMSPWVSIPYSDAMCLPFPAATACLYVNRGSARHKWLPWLGMGALAVLGYKIKPQACFVFLAVLLASGLEAAEKGFSREIFQKLGAAFLGIACAALLSRLAISSMPVEIDRERAFHLPHFFMMGMNQTYMGVWNFEDADFSASIPTPAERDRAAMEKGLSRLREMGAVGLSKHLVRKTLTNYYDGTFGWGGEGTFFHQVPQQRDNPFCGFFRGLYYTRAYAAEGKFYPIWSNCTQALWLAVLFFQILAGLAPKSPEKNAMLVAVMGLTVFEWVFEARARYLFIYVPLYIVLAVYGLQYATGKIRTARAFSRRGLGDELV